MEKEKKGDAVKTIKEAILRSQYHAGALFYEEWDMEILAKTKK